ncbi:MAG TPA: FAD:protein FMN transferase [Bryobacteraceae bacterium]|jgi:thiamine biosynthesis lipoprotein|nr:FAD:protein FMN transferase [Bryobacteraceae bacterium]
MSSSSLLLAGMALSALTALQPFEAVEPHMGTLFRIKLYAANRDQAQAAFHAAFTRISELDDILSDYKSDSEINRLCRTAVHHPVPVSDDLFRVVSASETLSEQSGGAFDITIGPLTHLWRQARKAGHVPESTAISEAAGHCGFHKVHLNAAAHTLELDQSGMQLDAGGIAKGYAADEALRVLSKCGIRSALVAASGDLAFSDAPPGRIGWKIGVDSLDNPEAPFTRVLMLANRAVSTSGPEEQHLDANGKRYSHIIDPKTGMGLTSDITATVIARSGTEADGLATALTVLGAERGLDLVNRTPGASAIIVAGKRVWKSEVQP